MNKKKISGLRRLFKDEKVVIKETDGKTKMAEKLEVHYSSLGTESKSLGLENPQEPSKETAVELYEMTQDADFKSMFGQFCKDAGKPDEVCFTQNQIVEFCQNHKNYLHTDRATFFLFKEDNNHFVVDVRLGIISFLASLHAFQDSFDWDASYLHCLAVPVNTSRVST
jgi:hypothetical protein